MGIVLALAGCALASCGRCFRPKGLRSLTARRGALARPEWLRRPAFISPSPRDFVASLRHPCPPAAGFANRHKNSATEQARRAVFIPLCGEGGIIHRFSRVLGHSENMPSKGTTGRFSCCSGLLHFILFCQKVCVTCVRNSKPRTLCPSNSTLITARESPAMPL